MRHVVPYHRSNHRRRSVLAASAILAFAATLVAASDAPASDRDKESNSLRVTVAQIAVTRDISASAKTIHRAIERTIADESDILAHAGRFA